MNSARTIVVVAGRYIRQVLQNKVTVLMLLLAPLFIAVILGYADGRASSSLAFGVVRSDKSPSAAALQSALDDAHALRVHTYSTRAAMERAIRRADVVGGVEIPAGYGDAVQRTGHGNVDIVGKPSNLSFVAARADVALVVAAHEAAVARRDAAANIAVDRVTADKGVASGTSRMIAGMMLFFGFDSAMTGTSWFLDDRRRGVVARMSTTPNARWLIAAGEMLGRFVVIVAQSIIILAGGALFFGVHWGDLAGVAAVVVLFSLLSTSASMMVGVLMSGRSVVEAEMATAGIILVAGFLGGAFWSLAYLPGWLRVVSHASPFAWAMDGFDHLLATNATFGDLFVPLLALAAWIAVTFAVVAKRMRHASATS